MRDTMALVLSGGSGERLSVLSEERAVSAIPFGGKYRVIDFPLTNCCHSEIEHVAVIAQHAPTSLNDHVGAGRPWDLDRRSGPVQILQPYTTRSHAGWYRGTADAIAQNLDAIEDRRVARVLSLSGDHVYRMDYRELIEAHLRHRAAVTLAVTRVPPDQSHRFGMVSVDHAGRVRTLEEKPAHTEAPYASMGIYVFETEVLVEMLRGRPVDLVLNVLRPMVEAGDRVCAWEFEGYWEDVGTVASYYGASQELVAPKPRFQLHDARWPILTRDEERPPVLVRDDAILDRSLVANGCRVAGTVRRSILFPGVVVERGAEVTDAVVMSDSVIGPGARIERAILDKYVKVGERARIGGAAGPPSGDGRVGELNWLEGLVLVGKDAFIPDGVQVSGPAVVGIGADASQFTDGTVPAGTLMASRPWYQEL